jgi:MFS family permease
MTRDKEILGFSGEFWILCSVVFAYFFSFNLILPQLPNHLTALGGENYKGAIIGLFALSALGTRPFSGKLVDNIGRKPIMIFGVFVSIYVLFSYPLMVGFVPFLALRFVHGISAGCTPTATTAIGSDIVPAHKRGEAMGILGMSGNLGMSMGPALGSEVAFRYSNNAMFIVAAVIAATTLIPAFKLKESHLNTVRFKWSLLKLRWQDIIEPRVIVQGLVMTLTVCTFGALLTLIPDYCLTFGIVKNGYFFTVVTLTSLFIRVISGKLSDKFGREVIMLFGVSFLIAANLMIITANSTTTVFAAAAVFGISTGINSPTLFAWTIDKGNPKYMGRGISTLFIFLEFGIILGSVIPAWLYGNNADHFPRAFMFTLACSILALFAVIWAFRKR